MKFLSIGCGKDWKKLGKNWEGLDIVDYGQKYVQDLETVGLEGIESDSVHLIQAYNIFEHLDQFVENRRLFVFNECWRVLRKKPEGILDIIVPRFNILSVEKYWEDPTHKSIFTTGFFQQYLCGGRPRGAKYYDHKGRELKKWGIESKNDKYTWEVSDTTIHVRLTV